MKQQLINSAEEALLVSPPSPADNRYGTYRRNKQVKILRRKIGQAICDYQMIAENDRVMVCISGGKDSYTLLDILIRLQRHAKINFSLHAVHLDQEQPGYDPAVIPAYLQSIGIEHTIIRKDTYSIVKSIIPEGKTMCGLCSRLRRGILYNHAIQHHFDKIALGHHRDDMIETLFLNMFYGGKLKAMPPKLRSDDGCNTVIRPLAYCDESEISRYARSQAFPIVPCNLCGNQENNQRKSIKAMLQGWEKQYPGRAANIFRSLQHVAPSQLADRALFDFSAF